MSITGRFMTGLAFGLEFAPQRGIYLCLYLGIAEIVFFNEDELEEIE